MVSRYWFAVVFAVIALFVVALSPVIADRDGRAHKPSIVSHQRLRQVLQDVVAEGNGGFNLNMWATIVDRDGVVRTVAFSGKDRGDQWPGSRAIATQKANAANAFSLPGLALSTANLYSAVQPGGSLFGLQFSNPVDPGVVYKGPSRRYGTRRDPMVGKKSGGVNVFGGGLALYNADGKLLGAIGVSGDSSCADHNIAWKVRHALNLDNVPAGVSTTGDDNIVYDISIVDGTGVSASGWGHPECAGTERSIGENLPSTHPIGPLP